MIKLKNILNEILNNYSIEVDLFIDKTSSHYDITNEIRALRGITIVTIITPDDYIQKTGSSDEYMRLKIKFVTRGEVNDMLQSFLNSALAKDKEDKLRIIGVKSMKFRKETLKRI
tara:strand:+ start:219 stop:563 length:345 start_codon:yes stop_codon:yes gene_type:complete